MAFYSVSVDDHGKEINTTRRTGQTYRKLNIDSIIKENYNENPIKYNSSSITTRTAVERDNSENTFKTVRYINSAAFIENQKPKPLKIERQNDNIQDKEDGEDHEKYQSHIMESIPLLELNSNQSCESFGGVGNENLTYSFRKINDVTKILQKPDAYNEWSEAKRQLKIYEKQKKIKKAKEEEEEKRKKQMQSEEKFHQWLERKKQHKEKMESKKSNTKGNTNENQIKTNKNKEDNIIKDGVKKSKKLDENKEDNAKKLKAWLKQKLEIKKHEKEKAIQEKNFESELKKKREEEAQKSYKNWLRTAPYKPKPVPLNQGFFTLKGSVSDIYVNPNPWVSTIESEAND